MATEEQDYKKPTILLLGMSGFFVVIFGGLTLMNHLVPVEVFHSTNVPSETVAEINDESAEENVPTTPTIDKNEYATRMLRLANNGLYELLSTHTTEIVATSSTGSSTVTTTTVPAQDPQTVFTSHKKSWPAESTYPEHGAILPFKRIVAYYGNFYSTRMGALGEYPPEEMKRRLMAEVARWEAADPDTPVIPAIDYIAVTAQEAAGNDGMYRLHMPDEHIQKAVDLAADVEGIVFLEIQPGFASLAEEIKRLEPWLALPEVHLALDPEFRMKNGNRPGTAIGVIDASDINAAIEYLDKLVKEHNLPPKVLLIHRFTTDMVTNATAVVTNPNVQVVMVMDGWGPAANKIGTYYHVIEPEPVQFTGFKVFYKNDLKEPSTGLLTPQRILELTPKPIYIQYQ